MKFIKAVNKAEIEKLQTDYKNHCSNLNPEKMTYSHERLKLEDKKLASFLGFTRQDPKNIPLENIGIRNILSAWGWILVILPLLFTCTSIFSFFFSCLFFYFPTAISEIYRVVMNHDYEIEVVDDDQIPIE